MYHDGKDNESGHSSESSSRDVAVKEDFVLPRNHLMGNIFCIFEIICCCYILEGFVLPRIHLGNISLKTNNILLHNQEKVPNIIVFTHTTQMCTAIT